MRLQVRQGGTQGPALALALWGTMQLSCAQLCPWEGISFAAFPNPLSLALLTCSPHWDGALRALCTGSPLPRASPCPQPGQVPPGSALLPIPRSWSLGASLSDRLTQAHGSGGQLFWLWTKVTQGEVNVEQSVAIFQLEKRKFPTIIRAGRSCDYFPGKQLEQGPDMVLRQCLTCPQEGGPVGSLRPRGRGPCWPPASGLGMEPRAARPDRLFAGVRLCAGGRAGSAATGQAWGSEGPGNRSSHSASLAHPLFSGGLG